MTVFTHDNDSRVGHTLLGPSIAATYNTSLASTVQVTLNAATQMIEVSAIGAPVLLRWGTGAASTAAFDSIVQTGQTRIYRVPANTPAVNFIQQATTATLVVNEY